MREMWSVALCLLLALGGCARANSPDRILTPAQFEDQVVEEIQKQFPSSKVTRVSDSELRVEGAGVSSGTLHLERAYGLYEGTPAELPNIVRTTAKSIAPIEAAKAEALLVLVRPGAYATDPESPAKGALNRPMVGNLTSLVAVDRPDKYDFLPASNLRSDLKMDDAAIWSVALENTRRRLNLKPKPLPLGQPYEINTGQDLAASLLVFDEYWNSPELSSRGPLVVAVFARDILYVAPLSDGASVERLRKLMAAVRDDPNGLANDLLVRRNGRWELLP